MNTTNEEHATLQVETKIIGVDPRKLKEFKGGNTRRKQNQDAFVELCESIKNIGMIQKPVVRACGNGDYEIVVGHRRVAAAINVGLENIDVELRELSDREAMELHLCENTVRQDLDFVSQIQASKRWVSFFNGDRESAAKRLMWSVKKLNERLELVHCCDAVLDALDEGKIKAGHALVLSILPEKIQIGTLIRVIDEKLSVAELKQRAKKIQLPLHTAKFDKSDCNSCKHNSERQVGLFDLGDDKSSTCSLATCYRDKTQQYLGSQKAELEEKYGKVLFFSESDSADRTMVSPKSVGETQFNDGCSICSKRILILDDRPAHEGAVLESQCIDLDCNTKCEKAYVKSQKTKLETNTSSPKKSQGLTTSNKQSSSNKEAESAKTDAAYHPSNVVIEKHKQELVDFARNELKDDELFRIALAVACVRSAHSEKRGYNKVAEIAVELATTKTKQEIMVELSESITDFIMTSDGADNANAFNFFQLPLLNMEGMADKAIQQWQPSKDNISSYTIAGLTHLCETSKLSSNLNEAESKKFNEASSGKKKDFINSILSFKFDWSQFATSIPKITKALNN